MTKNKKATVLYLRLDTTIVMRAGVVSQISRHEVNAHIPP